MFKRDEESTVNRGAVIFPAHFRPEMGIIIEQAAYLAPPLRDNQMWVTEGYRDIRESRDLHEELRAVDIDCTRVIAQRYPLRYSLSKAWSERLQEALGPSYQVILHGGEKALHLHIELDP